MKIGRFSVGAEERLGVVLASDGELKVLDASAAARGRNPGAPSLSMASLLEQGASKLDELRELSSWACRSGEEAWLHNEPDVQWLVPVARSFCIAGGRNFAAHKAETAHIAQNAAAFHTEFPMGFIKLPGSMVPTRSTVRRPDGVAWFDYEIEPAAVIGSHALDVAAGNALRHVFGYTILNDLSARELQRKEMANQAILLGKNFPGFCPVGPWITTADEIPDPSKIEMELRVNGEVRQQANCGDLIFGFDAMVAHWSRMGLEPGTLISTGSPEGVAISRRPDPTPFFLKPGDVVEAQVTQIGTLVTFIS